MKQAKEILRLSYSAMKLFQICPARYKAEMVEPSELPPPTEREVYNFAFGNIMNDVMEHFYESQMYMKCNTLDGVKEAYMTLRDKIPEFAKKRLDGSGELGVKGKPLTFDEIVERCKVATKRFVASVIRLRLFGAWTKAEAKFDIQIDEYGIRLTGRSDLAIVKQKPKNTIIIVDFKSRRNDHVDVQQLLFYALLWYYKWGTYPSQIAFFYFEGEPSYEIIEFKESDVQKFMADILLIRDKINAEKKFRPVVNDYCWGCRIRYQCEVSPYYEKSKAKEELKEKPEVFNFNEGQENNLLEGIFDDD